VYELNYKCPNTAIPILSTLIAALVFWKADIVWFREMSKKQHEGRARIVLELYFKIPIRHEFCHN